MSIRILNSLSRFFAAGGALFCALLLAVLLLVPQAALAAVASGKVTTNHWKKGAAEGFSLTATVTVPSAQAGSATMTLSGAQVASPVSLAEDSVGTTYSVTVPLAARPAVGEAYAVNVTYFDNPDTPTPPETLSLTVGAVLDSFATLVSPLGGVGSLSNPTFTWSAPQGISVAGYRLSISGLNDTPWMSAQLGTLSGQYLPTSAEKAANYPASLASGTLYDWSVYAVDSLGNSSENRDGLVMIGANIAGKVTDFAGAPVAGATVSVFLTNNSSVTATTTRADGSYLIGGLNSTNYWLKYSKDGKTVYYSNRLDAPDNFANSAGVLKTGIDAVLGGWGTITGNVVTSSGAGLSGYVVELLNTSGQATSYPAVTTTTGGKFTFPLLAPGTYKVKVIGANGYASLVYAYDVLVSEGQTTELPSNVVLQKVNITGTVTNSSGAPVAGVWVYLLTTAGNFVDNFFGVQTAADGSYAIAGVGTGNYKVLFDSDSYAKQYYNRKAAVADADIIAVSSTAVKSGIDAVLGSGRPTITGFSVPTASASLTVSGITLTATEPTYGVAGYLITESAIAPSATAAGWTASAPTSYTFTEVGEKTLYAWAKGATGLVSATSAASVSVEAGPVTPGDSNGDGKVSLEDVKLALDMYLGTQPSARFVDTDGDDSVSLPEVQTVINSFIAAP